MNLETEFFSLIQGEKAALRNNDAAASRSQTFVTPETWFPVPPYRGDPCRARQESRKLVYSYRTSCSLGTKILLQHTRRSNAQVRL